MIWTDDFSKKPTGMSPGSRIFFNFCDFCFSWTMDHALSYFENFDCQGGAPGLPGLKGEPGVLEQKGLPGWTGEPEVPASGRHSN